MFKDNFILGALYLPHENSKYHYSELFDDLSLNISTIKGKFDLPVMLIGDLNSRTGQLNEIMLLDIQDEILDERTFTQPYVVDILKSLNIPVKRCNLDTKINNNGRKLVEMCKIHELCLMNGRVGSDKNVGGLTCADKSAIDYIMCSPDLLLNVSEFCIDVFDPLLSDKHSPICVTLSIDKIELHEKETNVNNPQSNKIYKIKCEWDDDKTVEYQMNFDENKINHTFLNLSSANTNEMTQVHMDSISSDLKEILIEPAKITGMYKQIRPTTINKKNKCNKPWFNGDCKASKKNYQNFKKTIGKQPNEADKLSLKNLANNHKKVLRKVKRKFEKDFNAKIKSLRSSDPGKYWNLINPRKKSVRIGDISLDNFWTHFSELNKDNSNESDSMPEIQMQNTNEIINEPFTIEEIKKHISSLKKNKSPGIDHILNEFIKHCPETLMYVIVLIFNIVLETGLIPSDWTIGIIKALYKNKGNINDVNNYRGITLLSCIGKLFTSVINTRLYTYLTHMNILGSEQAGFRPNHSTLDHIFALQILTNFYIQDKKQLFCAFVDYSKAFDFVNRTYLWQKLLFANINGKILNVIKNMYKNAKSQVSVNNTLSESFPCQIGVRQGENLSPLLFALFLNDFKIFLSEKYNGLTKITASIAEQLNVYLKIFCLLYADDTIALAESAVQLQKALDGLFEYCNRWALNINLDKTKVIIFSRGKIRKFKSFKLGGNSIEVVEDYVYLGTTFNFNGTFKKAKAKQTLQARKATHSILRKVRVDNLSVDVFIELFERLAIPVLLYGSEIWGYEEHTHLQVMCNKVMRKFLNLHKSTSTCMINGELGLREISEYIENRMLNFWYNIATGVGSKISSILYNWIKILYDQNMFKSVWLDKIKTILNNIGMTNLFNDITTVNKNWFKNTIKIRLNDIYNQKWSEHVFNNPICLNYRAMTVKKHLQEYFVRLPKPYMYAMCKFKCANHRMPIVNGRYANIPVDERLCMLWQSNEIFKYTS